MGTKLTTKRAGTCPECKKTWNTGDEAYWDNSVKNSANFSVICIDEDCFKEQGGKLTPRTEGGFQRNSGFTPRPQRPYVDVTLKVPGVEISPGVRARADMLKEYIRQADELVEELYTLPANDQTRGQIRSKFVDQLIAIQAKKG